MMRIMSSEEEGRVACCAKALMELNIGTSLVPLRIGR